MAGFIAVVVELSPARARGPLKSPQSQNRGGEVTCGEGTPVNKAACRIHAHSASQLGKMCHLSWPVGGARGDGGGDSDRSSVAVGASAEYGGTAAGLTRWDAGEWAFTSSSTMEHPPTFLVASSSIKTENWPRGVATGPQCAEDQQMLFRALFRREPQMSAGISGPHRLT